MEPLTIDCSGGFSSSFYGNPFGSSFAPSASMNPSTSSGEFPTVDPEDVVIFVREELGRGAYGSVVRGTYKRRPCAIKLSADGNDFPVVREEAKNLHALRHEGVIQLFGVMVGVPQGLVLELMEGGSLHEFLHSKTHFRYSTRSVVWWSLQCTRALEHIHSLGFVHRDIKPLNLLLDNFYQTLKICDFGTTVPQKTSMTNNRGTTCWMAPEVFQGRKYDAKADVFSFGITLWEMVTRKFPFEELGLENPFAIQWQKYNGLRPAMVADCISPLAKLMTSCWAENAADRPDISDVVRVLEVLTEIYPVPSPPPFDLSTKAPAQARYYSRMKQESSINDFLIGDQGRPRGPKVVDGDEFLKSHFTTDSAERSTYVGTNASCEEPPSCFRQYSYPRSSVGTSSETSSVASSEVAKASSEVEKPKKKHSLPGRLGKWIKTKK